MKVILSLLVFLLFIPVRLSSFSLSATSSGTVEIKGDGTVIKFGTDEVLIKSPSFNFGDMEDGGIIAALNSPYSSYSLLPSFSLYSPSSRIFGSSVILDHRLHLFSFLGERKGAGVVWKENSFTLSLLYGTPRKDGVYQTKGVERTKSHTLWALGEYALGKVFYIRGMASLASMRVFSFSVLSSVSFSLFTITLGRGRVQAFTAVKNSWMNYAAVEIKGEDFEIKHELKMEDDPVYLREYRDYEYNMNAKLTLWSVTLTSTIKKTFTSGREKREERINIIWGPFTVGYKRSTNSLYLKLERNGIKIEYEDEVMSIAVTSRFEEGRVAVTTEISSKRVMKWTLEIEI